MSSSEEEVEELAEDNVDTETNTPEGEPLVEQEENEDSKANDMKLITFFLLLVASGSANTVFYKLSAIPLYNYPNFLNVTGNAAYVVLTFLYIIPVARYGWFNNAISPEQIALPKKPFAVIGFLDCMATSLQVVAAVYVPGTLLVLLPQAAIPISMVLSKQILGEKYRWFQYVGAITVLVGILAVLEPVVSHRHEGDYVCEAIDLEEDCTICQVETTEYGCLSHQGVNITSFSILSNSSDASLCQWIPHESVSVDKGLILTWAGILIFSCVPMALSGIYKEITVGGEVELDPVYINGWVALFQTIFSFFLAVPIGLLSSPIVPPQALLSNMYEGLMCYLGFGSITGGCHPDVLCDQAAAYFNWGLVVNIVYTVATILVLKYGSANIYFLALTAMVPIGNLTFALPFVPGRTAFHLSDILGLCVIMAGLIMYRFAGMLTCKKSAAGAVNINTIDDDDLGEPLLDGTQQ